MLDFQSRFDCRGQRAAMLLGVFQFTARVRILVAATAHHEQRRDAGVIRLEIFLCIPGIVAQPLEKAHGRVVTSVTKHHRPQCVVRGIVDTEHWNCVIHWPVRIRVISKSVLRRRAAIHGDATPSKAVREVRRLHLFQ